MTDQSSGITVQKIDTAVVFIDPERCAERARDEPELNLVRIGNRGSARNLTIKALSVDRGGQPVDRNLPAIAVPPSHDLAVTVTDWSTLDLQAQAVAFQ